MISDADLLRNLLDGQPTPTRRGEQPIGRPATLDTPNTTFTPRLRVNGQLFTGTGLTVTRYRIIGGREVFELQLVDEREVRS